MSTHAEISKLEETSAEKILERLVSFDTTSSKSNLELIDYIRGYLRRFGVDSAILMNDAKDKACLWATVGHPGVNGVVLAGHTDVVPVIEKYWDTNPFTLIKKDGKYFGRGTADMKGFIACALSLVPEFMAARPENCFHLALTYNEETDFAGALNLVSYLRQIGTKPAWIWLGEPTGLAIIDEHKGYAAFETRIKGVPGHSSDPRKGANAIKMAAKVVGVIDEVEKEKSVNPIAGSRFDPAYSTINIGVIKGGRALNIISGKSKVTWEVRVHPGDLAEIIADKIGRRAKEVLADVLDAYPGKASVQTNCLYSFPPFCRSADNKGVEALRRLMPQAKTMCAGFATEASLYQSLGDVAICGPGFIEQTHQPNEFTEESQVNFCVDLMRRVLLPSSAPRHCLK